MDYLNDGDPNSGVSLGIEGIWLSPIFTSPTYHKYDASSYYEIDPQFGTMEDLQELVDLCHTRGVKVILDLVINHTATGHPWFQEFKKAQQAGDTENEYYDFYSWSADPASGKAWAPIPGTDHSYECNFFSGMPELNFDNEAVCQAMVDVAAYYLDMGLDGFRFDAAKYIYYGEEDRNVAFWEWYMGKLREIKPDIYSVAEVWDDDSLVLRYTTSTNCFNFSMSQPSGRIAETAKAGDVNAFMAYMNHYIDQMKGYNPQAFPVTFIANHDMDRAAGFLTVASGQAKIAANLSMLLPGSSFIYYGEEIGLKGSRGGANTDANRRLAMFWGDGDTVKDPEGTTYNSEQTNGSVADQLPDGDSLYNHYKKLILIRKANPEIANGSFQALNNPDSKLGGFLATWEGSTVAVLHNTTTAPLQVDLAVLTDIPLAQISAYAGMGGAVLEGTVLTLDGQTSVVLR
jgi:glycosidase